MERIIVEKEDGTVIQYERGIVIGFNNDAPKFEDKGTYIDVDLAVHDLCTIEIDEASKILQDYVFKKKSSAFGEVVERLFGKEGINFEREKY